jgi:transcriptional regulator with XRE-family HTH domain
MSHKVNLSLGERLALWRRRRNITKADTAVLLDVPEVKITQWENGQPMADTFRRSASPGLGRMLEQEIHALSPGEWCWLCRRRAGMTLKDVAHTTGMSLSSIQAIERSRSPRFQPLVDWWTQRQAT